MTKVETRNVVIVEDEKIVRLNLQENLRNRGFSVFVFENAEEALSSDKLAAADVIVMDINLPGMNGFEATHQIKRTYKGKAVVFLTVLSDLNQRIQGFETGADDYIMKPFFIEEVVARLKAVMKRYSVFNSGQATFHIADLFIDLKAKQVFRKNEEIKLSITEFNLLTLLAEGNEKPVSKEEIMKKVWRGRYSVSDNTIEVYINLLRNKIDKSFAIKLIHTKPGFGYFLSSQK